eukprot:Phypoly_transcript_04462.p1 GENE.Phypoly_transcript_04462~~Phypoly_transcript_04462.p1  ORF type:complete len:720 (+),score=129.63 Phypoly_transcript_04462:187-2160(+)
MEKLTDNLQIQQQQLVQQQSSPPQPESKSVPLAFGRRVNSAKGLPSTPSQSPPQQALFQHYPSSPQTPTTRLAAKSKAAAGKPSISAVTRPISSLPRAGTVPKGKPTKPDVAPPKVNLAPLQPPPETHRNITPIPPSTRLHRDTFSEVPPRSASPEIPRQDEDDDDYVDGSSYYESDEEFPAQEFGDVGFGNKEYQSSRYQSNGSTSAGSDRATSALAGLNLNGNPPISYTSHVNTRPVVKDTSISTGAWGSLVPPPSVTQNRRYSAELNEEMDIPRIASMHKGPTESSRDGTTRDGTTRDSARRPATHAGRPNLGPVAEHSTEETRGRTSAGRQDTARASSTGTPRTSDLQRARSSSAGTPRTNDPQRASVRSSNATPRTASAVRPDSAQRTGTAGARMPSTPETNTRVNTATKLQESKKGSMENLMKTAQENGLHKSSSGNFKYSANVRDSSDVRASDDVRASSDVRASIGSRGSARAAQPVSARRMELQGSRRNSMENAYSRLVAESDLPEVRKQSISEDDEDDMVNTGEEGDGRDESGVMEDGTRDSFDVDQDAGDKDGYEDENEEEGGDEDENGEIDEDIEEDELYNNDEDRGGVYSNDEDNEGEVAEEFQVCSTNDVGEEYNESDEEGDVEYDSAKNAYYDTKSKKAVQLH